ncbi:MAG: ABC transporter ATP-binding protein [Sphaerochaetaceae bacterium]|nr:ABC transporter ATP-binding protein [Sphaerochaetaceae bacterium]
MNLDVKNLSFSYGSKGPGVLKDVSFSASSGEIIVFLGPNGVGKSTLFRCILGFLRPDSGQVLIDGKSTLDYKRQELSRLLAYIPQSYSPAFNHSVLDSVLMGVTGQLGMFEMPGKDKEEKALSVMKELGIENLANRGSMKISGGERQLMLLARAIVQDASLLIMDEPAANLDFGNAFKVMKRVTELREKGYTMLISTHNPDHAYRYATRVIAMKDGKVIADGNPSVVLTGEIMKELYSIDVAVSTVNVGKSEYKVCTPVG